MVSREEMEPLIARLKRKEGFSDVAYEDQGGYSIGYGYRLSGRGIPADLYGVFVSRELRITEKGAEALLRDVLMQTSAELQLQLPWVATDLSLTRRLCLLEMGYNLGVPRLLMFRRMLAALHGGRWEDAAREALDSRWARQVGSRAVELARMLRTGMWEEG
jgi:lysozyme